MDTKDILSLPADQFYSILQQELDHMEMELSCPTHPCKEV
jgi:hypothetical protein